MMTIELTTDGVVTQTIEPCDIGVITKQCESRAFEYVADDFVFSLEEGEELMDDLFKESEIKVRVFDSEDAQEYFRGMLTSEGTGQDEEEGPYQFRAVQETKQIFDAWRDTPAQLWYYNKFKDSESNLVDPQMFPNSYLETVLSENTLYSILLPDQFRVSDVDLDNRRSANYKDDGYSVFDLVTDAAKYTNSVVWPTIDTNGIHFDAGTKYLLFQNRQFNRGRDVMLDDATVFRFIRRLRSPVYRSVIYQTDKGNFAIETKSSYRVVKNYKDIDKKNALDLTGLNDSLSLEWNQYNSSGTVNAQGKSPLNYLFPRLPETRQNTWNDLLKTTAEYEIGVDRLIPLDIFDRVFYKAYKALKAYKIEYDIVDNTTIVIAKSS